MDFIFKEDCTHFKGYIPCTPHKNKGVHCSNCTEYVPVSKKILIIKLGAIGDVIRTTPLVAKYKKLYPNCFITWLTWTPAILPNNEIDEILKWDHNSLMYVQESSFDIAINLDKEKEAGALLKKVTAKEKFGYVLKNNVIQPINEYASHKFFTGLFDDYSKANTKSYMTEVFEICNLEYSGEEYLLDNYNDKNYDWSALKGTKIVGLNTGCGPRWTTRLWSTDKWIELIKLLQKKNINVLLLGGKEEDERNKVLAAKTGAQYMGCFSLPQFINLMNQCELIVTQVTMGMHLTLGLKKKMVLMNNIFNPYEFDLFGRGKLLQPTKKCECYYRGKCQFGTSCMEDLPAENVEKAVLELL